MDENKDAKDGEGQVYPGGAIGKGLVVIGTSDFVLGFALAGVRHSIVARRNELLATIESHNDAAIIIVDEELSGELTQKQRDALETSISPIIILLGKDASKLTQRLRKNIKTTLGVDLLKQNNISTGTRSGGIPVSTDNITGSVL